MTTDEFMILDEYDMEAAIHIEGNFLCNYIHGNTLCDAYQVGSFYVTFSYTLRQKGKAIISIFTDPEELPFFNDIEIPDF